MGMLSLLPVGRKVVCVRAAYVWFTCVYTNVQVGRCVCVCVHVQTRGWYQMSSSITFHLIYWRVFHLNPKLSDLASPASQANQLTPEISFLHPWCWSSCLGGKYFYHATIFPVPKVSFLRKIVFCFFGVKRLEIYRVQANSCYSMVFFFFK